MAPSTMLFVTQVAPYRDGPAGVHGVLDQAATAMAQLAESTDLVYSRVVDVREVEAESISAARAVALFTIGETPWSDAQRTALVEGVRAGRTALVAVHSASDACYGWDEYGTLVGARFDGHPWTQTCTVDVLDTGHPATVHLGRTWRWHDEVYTFRDLRSDAHLLLAARPGELQGSDPDRTYPLSWCFAEGSGRVFATSLGHFPHAWESPDYLRHLAGGLAWSLGTG